MRPMDDTFMRCLFKDNVALTELVLRIILNKKDLSVTKIETQADMKRVTGAYEGDSEIGKLMHDFRCSDPDEMCYDLIKEKAKYLKESEEGCWRSVNAA